MRLHLSCVFVRSAMAGHESFARDAHLRTSVRRPGRRMSTRAKTQREPTKVPRTRRRPSISYARICYCVHISRSPIPIDYIRGHKTRVRVPAYAAHLITATIYFHLSADAAAKICSGKRFLFLLDRAHTLTRAEMRGRARKPNRAKLAGLRPAVRLARTTAHTHTHTHTRTGQCIYGQFN